MKKTIRRKTFIAAALMSAMCTANYSFADVIKVTDDARLLQQHDAQYFSQSGLSGEEAKIIETGGADLPLSLAASLIIPENWKIESSGDYENAIISWSGGVSWPLIVRNFSEKEEIYVNLDWIKKIASIHVPGRAALVASTTSGNHTKSLSESREAFVKAQETSFKKQERYRQQTDDQKAQFESILNQQREAQESNQELIARINESHTDAINQKNALEKALEEQRKKYAELKEKYAVIDPTLSGKDKVDPTILFKQHQEAWVLPYDDSPDYYLKGGHSDIIEYGTNATFVAREGTVHEIIQKWADQIGWYVDYRAGINHNSPYEFTLKGTFREVTTQFISLFQRSDRPLNIDYLPKLNKTVKDPKTGEVTKYHGVVVISDLNYKSGR
ncbi:MAG: hypothetical protein CBC55_02910 [Gammaproteobacteria bacterium TMED95]|nr:MAG: hypothetical protein CBC55_02910 [Gammaproteobacteria bacterium TMED95]|tara:strand:+ start:21287 stop:22447 length:1161 start_codon:yes stop_codon:yes gene_type:complete